MVKFRKRKPVKPRDHPANGALICQLPVQAGDGSELVADIWLDLTRLRPILERAIYGRRNDPGEVGTGHAEIGGGAVVIHLRTVRGAPKHGQPGGVTLGTPDVVDWAEFHRRQS